MVAIMTRVTPSAGHSHAGDPSHAGPDAPPESAAREAIAVTATVIIVLATAGTWLAGQLAALMFTGAWPRVGFGEAMGAAARLPWHLADPRAAWPAAAQGALPGTAAFYVAAMTASAVLGFSAAAAVRWMLRLALWPRLLMTWQAARLARSARGPGALPVKLSSSGRL
jgi:hypothetical protein